MLVILSRCINFGCKFHDHKDVTKKKIVSHYYDTKVRNSKHFKGFSWYNKIHLMNIFFNIV